MNQSLGYLTRAVAQEVNDVGRLVHGQGFIPSLSHDPVIDGNPLGHVRGVTKMVQGLDHIVIGVVVDDANLALHISLRSPGRGVEASDTHRPQDPGSGVRIPDSIDESFVDPTNQGSRVFHTSHQGSSGSVFEDLLDLEDRGECDRPAGEVCRSRQGFPHLHTHGLHSQGSLSDQGILDLNDGATAIDDEVKPAPLGICLGKRHYLPIRIPASVLRDDPLSSVLA